MAVTPEELHRAFENGDTAAAAELVTKMKGGDSSTAMALLRQILLSLAAPAPPPDRPPTPKMRPSMNDDSPKVSPRSRPPPLGLSSSTPSGPTSPKKRPAPLLTTPRGTPIPPTDSGIALPSAAPSNAPPITHVPSDESDALLSPAFAAKSESDVQQMKTISEGVPAGKTQRITRPKYVFAQHTVVMDRVSGDRLAFDELGGLQRMRALSLTSHVQMVSEKNRRTTLQADPQAVAHVLLDDLDAFVADGFEWKPLSKLQESADAIIQLCNLTCKVLSREPRLLEVPSPAYVMGDLHGNIEDLLAFHRCCWRQGASVCPANLIFLGDYVDRRFYSVEVMMYLLSQKLIDPHKINLLRGNHELRETNMFFGFNEECRNKFGDDVGSDIWEAFNRVFDHMPMAAVVDGAIMCCHGGIPGPDCSGNLFDLNAVPCPLDNDNDHAIVRDILWSDPQEHDSGEDYVPNEDRGYSHKFSTNALHKFLRKNDLQYLIRAHQYKVHLGFQVQKKGRLLTVFSSSAYSGHKNEASCLLIADQKLRIMRLSSSAGAAMNKVIKADPGSKDPIPE